MEIKRNGSQPSGKGPAEYFTGTVRIDPLFNPPPPTRALGASVTLDLMGRDFLGEGQTGRRKQNGLGVPSTVF